MNLKKSTQKSNFLQKVFKKSNELKKTQKSTINENFTQNKPAAQAAGGDLSQYNSTNRPNPPLR